jgi:hypothetical protein
VVFLSEANKPHPAAFVASLQLKAGPSYQVWAAAWHTQNLATPDRLPEFRCMVWLAAHLSEDSLRDCTLALPDGKVEALVPVRLNISFSSDLRMEVEFLASHSIKE